MIEAVFFIADDGFSAWRAKGIVRRSLKELAEALGVEESQFNVQPDLHQLAEEQRVYAGTGIGRAARTSICGRVGRTDEGHSVMSPKPRSIQLSESAKPGARDVSCTSSGPVLSCRR